MMIRLCIALLLFAFVPAMAAERLSVIAQQQTRDPLLEQLQIQLRQADARAAEAERRERDAETRRLEEEAREASARARAAEQANQSAQRELSLQEARTELQDQAYSRLEILIGVFGVLITILVIFFALRTEKAAVTAARAGVEDIREKLEKRLAEAETLLEKIRGHKTEAEEIISGLRPGEPPRTKEDLKAVAEVARAALAKPPRDRSAAEYSAIITDFLTRNKWVEMLEAAQQMRLLHQGDEDFTFASISEAHALRQLRLFEKAIKVYDDVVDRFGAAKELKRLELVAGVLANKGSTLAAWKGYDDAITAYNDIIIRFGETQEPALRKWIATALNNIGFSLGALERHPEAVAAFDDVIARFGSAPELPLREQVAKAYYYKACVYARQGLVEETITALRALIEAGRPLDLEEIAKEADFDQVRSDPAFIKFLAENKG
jgi:tetratricopeptide (TPR) repeat protein